MVIDAILLLLCYFVRRKSAIARGIAVTIYAFAVLELFFQGNLSGTILHLLLLLFLIRRVSYNT